MIRKSNSENKATWCHHFVHCLQSEESRRSRSASESSSNEQTQSRSARYGNDGRKSQNQVRWPGLLPLTSSQTAPTQVLLVSCCNYILT